MSQNTTIDQLAGLLGTFIQQQQSINNSLQQQVTSQQESITRLISLLEANTISGNQRNQPPVQPSPRTSTNIQQRGTQEINTDTNQQQPIVPFHAIVERYVQANLPQQYQEHVSRPDYDARWWSWSLAEAAPVYTQGIGNNSLTRRRVLFNDILYSQIPTGSIGRYRNKYPERFRAIDDVNYNPTVTRNIVMAADGVIPVEQTTREITQRQLRKNLKAQGLKYVKQDPVARYMAQSLTVGELRNLEPNINAEIPGIETLSERVFFNGIVTETEYIVNPTYFTNPSGNTIDYRSLTIPMFVDLIKRALIRQTSQDIGPFVLPPYYSVLLWYNRPELNIYDPTSQEMVRYPAQQRRIKVFSGTVFNSLVTDFVVQDNLRAELLQTTGSDVQELAAHALDISRFIIQKIDLTRSGGSAVLLREYMSKPTGSNDHQVYTLAWGKIWDYRSSQNGCFMKIVNEVLKYYKRNQYTYYEQLWRDISPETYHREITFDQASNIAQRLGFKLYIYNADGEIIHGNDVLSTTAIPVPNENTNKNREDNYRIGLVDGKHNIDHLNNFLAEGNLTQNTLNNTYGVKNIISQPTINTINSQPSVNVTNSSSNSDGVLQSNANLTPLRVLFFEGHYMLIKDLYSSADSETIPKLSKEDAKKAKDFNFVPVYYDLETVYAEEAGAESNLRPYSISWLIESKQAICKVKTSDIPTTEIFDHLMVDIRSHGPGNRFVFIAYNGSGFDHVLLFSYLVRHGYRVKVAPKSTGKIRQMKFWIPYGQDGFSILEVWDPYLFVMRSLDQAAKDFGIPITKLPFNHEDVQTAYLTGRLPEFLSRNKQLIEEYNCRDVQVLRLFTNKLVQTLSNITGFPIKIILSNQTLPGLCYKFWKTMLGIDTTRKSTTKELQRAQDAVASSFIGKTMMPVVQQLENAPMVRLSTETQSEFPKAVKDVKIDKKIRSATIGGRVEGTPGIFHGDFRMVDVVSLYPTVMAIFLYPLGEEIVVKDGNQALQYYAQGYLGIYHINYDQSSLVTEHTILPQRINGKLSWTKGSGTAWVPLITIQLLMQYGAKVSIVPDEDGDWAIVWQKNSPMFKQYVNTLSKIKQEQDMYKAKGDSRYNPSLREMVKLMLNSLSGKVIQRNFDNHSVFVQSEKEFIEAVNKLANEDWVNRDVSVHPVTTNSAFIEYKIIDPYNKPMPSQLGVFIYAYARAYMFTNVFSRAHVYYSDTDSAVISFTDYNKLPPDLLPVHYIKGQEQVVREKQFGDLELEEADYELPDGKKIKVRQFNTVVVISPKIYALYHQNQIVKYRIKGVRKSDEFFDPDAVDPTVAGSGWKVIEKYEYDPQTTKYKCTHKNVERFFELLSQKLNNSKYTVKIRSWQFRKIVREGRIERRAIVKTI